MHKIQAEPFKRMALVDEMMLQKLKEEAITGYNPTLKAAVSHKDQIESVLQSPSQTHGSSKGFLTDEQRFALLRANQYFLNRLLQKVTNVTTPEAEAQSEAQSEAPEDAAVQADDEGDVFHEAEEGDIAAHGESASKKIADLTVSSQGSFNIPSKYMRKFQEVQALISKHPDIISTNKSGELVVHGEAQKGTSYPQLIRELFQQTSSPAVGLTRLVGGLISIGITPEMISSRRAKEAMSSSSRLMRDYLKKMTPPEHAKIKTEAASTSQSGSGRKRKTTVHNGRPQSPPGKRVQVLRLYK